MSLNRYGYGHMPKIVRNLYGWNPERTTISFPAKSSAALYLGQWVSINDATNGKEFGLTTLADDDYIFGFIVGFHRLDSNVPIEADPLKAGSITEPTGELPMKYTFAATNDEASTTSAILEQVEIMPIHTGDIVEVALWGGSTISVVRGTTTAAGTTASSDNFGVSMSVSTTYPWALLESTAAVAQANLDFMTVHVDGKKPKNTHHVYAVCGRAFSNATFAS